jgi:hypothetical protein
MACFHNDPTARVLESGFSSIGLLDFPLAAAAEV